MSDQYAGVIDRIPVMGAVDRSLKEYGPFGLPLMLGVVNLGAGLGALSIMTGADPAIYGAIWLALGVAISWYSISKRVIEDE